MSAPSTAELRAMLEHGDCVLGEDCKNLAHARALLDHIDQLEQMVKVQGEALDRIEHLQRELFADPEEYTAAVRELARAARTTLDQLTRDGSA